METMARTFEELITDKIDALYQGCLFLEGGDARGSERLLVSSATRAFREHTAAARDARQPRLDVAGADFDKWLDGQVIASFLETRKALTASDAIEPQPMPGETGRSLFRAAGLVPAAPRAALWLVLLRRWSYDDTARALGVDRDHLLALLKHRTVLTDAMAEPGSENVVRGVGG
jgi:hypothetical protein